MKNEIIVFEIEEQRYGLYLSSVDSVIRAVEIIPLPETPEAIIGVINVRGKIIPVINIRKKFRLPEKEIDINHCIILARTLNRNIALCVDKVNGVFNISREQIISTENIMPDSGCIEGIAKTESGLILIHNMDIFL
jgi:purine-binding chemotaxis protein CheW